MTSDSLSSTLLLSALLLTTKLLTHATPMGSHNDTGSFLNDVMRQVSQVQLEVNILKGTRASIKTKDCADVYKSGGRISGVYTIDPHDGLGAFDVFCDQTTAGGGWTVLQKRLNGSMDFNRTWEEYKHGFGNFFTQEFWLGLDKIHRLTRNGTGNGLRIELGVTNEELVYAEYGLFVVGNENTSYRLNNLSGATENDPLGYHRNFSFGTWDRDLANGKCDAYGRLGGGWWYGEICVVNSNLNGLYPSRGTKTPMGDITWATLGSTAKASTPTTTEMKIRPVGYN